MSDGLWAGGGFVLPCRVTEGVIRVPAGKAEDILSKPDA